MEIPRATRGKSILVDLNDIESSSGPYSMSFGFELEPYMKSIQKIGLIHTPLVKRNGAGGIDIIIGYRRIMALKSLHWKKVPCVDQSDAGLSPREVLLLNLYDNLTTRVFNEVEKGMILHRLMCHFSAKEVLADYMPLLHLPSHSATLDLFLKLDTLEITLKNAIVNGTLSLKVAGILFEIDPESRASILKLILNLKFNFNQQLQLAEYITDLSIKDDISISEYLSEKKFLKIIKDKKRNNPQKVKLILDILRARRFPLLTRSERTFNKRISNLDLPIGVKIKHPPFFEAPDYRLEILFRSGKELKEKIDSLSQTDGLTKIGDPWIKAP